MFRSRAGDQEVLHRALHPDDNRYRANFDDENGDEVRLEDDPTRNDDVTLVSSNTADHDNNSHWLRNDDDDDDTGTTCGPSRYVAYYDAASLYPSSGNYVCLYIFHKIGPWG